MQIVSWSDVAKRINDLIKENKYIEESIEEDREKKVDHDINYVKDIKEESQESIDYQDDLSPTDSEVYTEKINSISTYYYQGQSVASIGENGRLVIYDDFMPNSLKEDLYSLAYEKQLDSSLDHLEDGIVLEGIEDTFYIKDKEEIEGKEYYLLESQSQYDDIPNIIVNSDREIIDDDIVNGFEEFREFYISKDKIDCNQDNLIDNEEDYWIVEFNESSSLIEKNYEGQRLTKELLDEIKEVDEKIRLQNKAFEEDKYPQLTDEWVGYSKF